jgi:L-ornithine N5-oxygenase
VLNVQELQNDGLMLTIDKMDPMGKEDPEFLKVDALIVATGYTRDAHEDMLKDLIHLNPNPTGAWQVGRNYKLGLNKDLVNEDAGIWLQGSNESSHGISDTLLSILATRSGEIVESIFGRKLEDI